MITTPKSITTFIRRELGFKGKTEHSGRGAYFMQFEGADQADLMVEVLKKVPTWIRDGFVDTVEHTEEALIIEFKPHKEDTEGRFYRTFKLYRNAPLSHLQAAVLF